MLVTFEEVNAAYGDALQPSDRALVELWIRIAERRLESRLEMPLGDPRLDRQAVIDVLMTVLLRVVRAHREYQSESDQGYSYSRPAQDVSARIWFSNDDLADLLPRRKSTAARTLWLGTRCG